MMKAGSYQAWWLAAMMYGGCGMFSTPVTLTRKRVRTSSRTARRIQRYSLAGCVGSAWTSASSGASTSALNSGLVYWRGSGRGGSGIEEGQQRAVELVRALCLRRVAGPFDYGQPAVGNRGVRAGCVGDGEQRVVRAPDELHRHLDAREALGQVVLGAEKRPRVDERAKRREVCLVIPLGGVELAQVLEVLVVHRSLEVDAGADVATGDLADHGPGHPLESAAGGAHHRLAHARQRDEPVGHVHGRASEAERVHQHQPADAVRVLERQLHRDAAAEGCRHDGDLAEAATL